MNVQSGKNKSEKIQTSTLSCVFMIVFHFLHLLKFPLTSVKKQDGEYFDDIILYHNNIIFGVGIECKNTNMSQERSCYDDNVSISDSFFTRITQFSGNGGAIFVSDSTRSVSIAKSMFYYCSCSSTGGALYFEIANSILRMICANRCSASNYQFAYLVASQMNQVVYTSVSNCSHTTDGYYSIYLQSGNQRFDNSNSSMNKAYQVSGIIIWYPSSFTSSQCTFSNNKVSSYICIYFYYNSGIMSYANIINNDSPAQYGVVCVNGD